MKRLLLILIIVATLSFFQFSWKVELPPLPESFPRLYAEAPANSTAECEIWAEADPWTITRCENWEAGEVCFMANSGMMDCNFE